MEPEALIGHSSVAAVVSDPCLPDNPIVACNEAFERLTGYQREEIVGRNCRFLCGPDTEAEPVAILREAIASARPVMTELLNYRRDGTTFRNAVMVAPLFGDDGRLRYFLGSQIAVDEYARRRHAHARAQLSSLSARQRQILDALSRGLLNKQIAFELSLTERTVKMHRAAMLRALRVRTVAEAIRIAIEADH